MYPYVNKNARQNNNQLITYCEPVCYFLKNTTIPWEYYLKYPVNTIYNILEELELTSSIKFWIDATELYTLTTISWKIIGSNIFIFLVSFPMAERNMRCHSSTTKIWYYTIFVTQTPLKYEKIWYYTTFVL